MGSTEQPGTGAAPDSGGLAALFAAHRAELRRFLAARCGDAVEAEDLLQDLWIKAAAPSPAQPAGPIANGRAYLFRMANNLVSDRRRARLRAMRRDHAWVAEGSAGASAALPEDRPDPAPPADEQISRQQEAELLRTAIAGLPPGAQRALRLHRIDGHPQGDVAQIMGISRSGVEKHLAVAMRRLKQSMLDCGLSPVAASQEQGLADNSDPPLESNR